MSDSDDSPDENHVQQAVEEEPDMTINRKDLPRRLRTRYWHSWEEMLFVELWRKHFNEITCLDKNLPVFRIIAAGMRESGFHINCQEVRRKIKYIKNKYIAERSRLSKCEDENAKSEWQLYSIVHCLMRTAQKDPYREEQILTKILERNRTDPLYHILQSGMPVSSTLKKYVNGEIDRIPPPVNFEDSFPVENKEISECIAYSYKNKTKRSFTPRHRPSEVAIAAARAKSLATDGKSASGNRTVGLDKSKPTNVNKTTSSNITSRGITLKNSATSESIEQLQLENRRLVEECVMDKKCLEMEEQQLKSYEAFLEQLLSQYESL